jgi:hypothetical protein
MGTPSKVPPIRTEWAKHLRPFGKRQFWKRVRRAMRRAIQGAP